MICPVCGEEFDTGSWSPSLQTWVCDSCRGYDDEGTMLEEIKRRQEEATEINIRRILGETDSLIPCPHCGSYNQEKAITSFRCRDCGLYHHWFPEPRELLEKHRCKKFAKSN